MKCLKLWDKYLRNAPHFQYDASGTAVGFVHNNTTPYIYMRNLQGDVTGIVDANGNSVASYTYDAWGNIFSATGPMAAINPIRYRGYYYDDETGWYWFQTRYYNPTWCRFINADCMFIAGKDALIGSNMYAYCGGNPVMFVDPTGMASYGWEVLGEALAILARIITVADWLLPYGLTIEDEFSWGILGPFFQAVEAAINRLNGRTQLHQFMDIIERMSKVFNLDLFVNYVGIFGHGFHTFSDWAREMNSMIRSLTQSWSLDSIFNFFERIFGFFLI